MRDLSYRWSKIKDAGCRKCPLWKTAQSVCLIGRGNLESKVVIVGEAPGLREDDIDKPFAGRSGALLDSTLEAAGVTRDEVYITNVVHCRPPDNRTPTPDEVAACREYLDAELNLIRPKVIIVLGNTALKALTGRSGITKYRGNFFDYTGDGWKAKILATIHPAGVLRSPRFLSSFAEDIYRAFDPKASRRSTVNYDLITRVRDVEHICNDIHRLGKNRMFAFDFETTSLRFWGPKDKVLTCAISFDKDRNYVIPLGHKSSPFSKGDIFDVWTILENMLFLDPVILKVAHNFKFELKWLLRMGIDPSDPIFCTMLAHYILDENQRHDLKSLSIQHCKYGAYWDDVEKSGLYDGNARNVPIELLAPYNATDSRATYELAQIFIGQLKAIPSLNNLYHQLIVRLIRVYARMEISGVQIDIHYLHKLDKRFKRLLREQIEGMRANKICARYEERRSSDNKSRREYEINFNSQPQMADLLFKSEHGFRFKHKPNWMTEKGSLKTGEEVLIDLSLGKRHRDFPLQLIAHRKTKALASTFITGMAEFLDADNRVHPTFKIHGTVTGRSSCEQPNVQNLPRADVGDYDPPIKKRIRRLFIAPPGKVCVNFDCSQAELRVGAEIAGEKTMERWFREGRDVHTMVTLKRLGYPEGTEPDEIPNFKEERKGSKTVNFGVLYCVGDDTLAKNLSSPKKGIIFTPEDAHKFKLDYFKVFPRMEAMQRRQKARAMEYGYVETLFGRRRRLPDIESEVKGIREEALRQAVNSPIQGTAVDFAHFAMVIICGLIPGRKSILPRGGEIVSMTHDDVRFYIPKHRVKQFAHQLKSLFQSLPTYEYFGFEMGVPMEIDVEVGPNWGDMKKIDL